jgi:hypothetical protein
VDEFAWPLNEFASRPIETLEQNSWSAARSSQLGAAAHNWYPHWDRRSSEPRSPELSLLSAGSGGPRKWLETRPFATASSVT